MYCCRVMSMNPSLMTAFALNNGAFVRGFNKYDDNFDSSEPYIVFMIMMIIKHCNKLLIIFKEIDVVERVMIKIVQLIIPVQYKCSANLTKLDRTFDISHFNNHLFSWIYKFSVGDLRWVLGFFQYRKLTMKVTVKHGSQLYSSFKVHMNDDEIS